MNKLIIMQDDEQKSQHTRELINNIITHKLRWENYICRISNKDDFSNGYVPKKYSLFFRT